MSSAEQESPEPPARKQKRNPIAGLFGRSAAEADAAAALPEMDVAGGLDRALRLTGGAPRETRGPAFNAESVRDALAGIEASLYAIDRIRDVIEQAYEVAMSAQESEEVGARALLAESYDELRLAIGAIVEEVDDKAQPLVGRGQRQLDVKLGGKAHYSISPTRLDLSSKGLGLDPPRDAFASFDEIAETIGQLDRALAKADRAASGYCRDAQFLIDKMQQAAAAAA